MKSDLDALLAQRNLDGFLVLGDPRGAAMRYLTGNAHLEGALLLKPRNGPITLVHGSMERGIAAQTGLALLNRDTTFDIYRLLERHRGDRAGAQADLILQAMQRVGLRGRVGVYGLVEAGSMLALQHRIQAMAADVELVGEYGDDLFAKARETKDAQELAALRQVAQATCTVVAEVQEFIQGHRVREDTVVQEDGAPLTIGAVKRFLRARLLHHGLQEDHGTIFAQGRDAGIPHNHGDPEMPLRLGQTIVFDIFPRGENGYVHDMTRTWCLGHAPERVEAAWEQCKAAFDRVMAELAVGRACRDYQLMVCDHFEAHGHPTVRSHPGTQEGYVHSLGHGIGLEVHEGPRFSHLPSNTDVLQPGHVVTIEPGLYYPEQGFGIRIEDAVAFDADGRLVKLTEYPYDLVIPMRG